MFNKPLMAKAETTPDRKQAILRPGAKPAESFDPSFRERATSFALTAGCVVFILAMLVGWTSAVHGGAREFRNALVVAIICSITCWASTMRILAETAGAIDRLIIRLRAAVQGEMDISLDRQVREELPELVASIDCLLERARVNLSSFHDLAMHDSVTGLPNRLHLRREAERQLYSSAEQTQAALILIDLDRFKSVNDSLGHQIGDQLLGMVASRLNIVIEAEADNHSENRKPLAARLGGDEFTVLIPATKDENAIRRLGRRLLLALSEPYEIAGHSVEIGASIGIALHNEQSGGGLTSLMRNADLAMYHAKARGRGQVQLYTAALGAQNEGRRSIENDLRRALIHNQFEIYLQPQIRAADKQVITAEALIRWRHPQGLRLPGSFIAIAEESGLIVEIGEWVIRSVARTLGQWHKQGINTRIGINISPRQLERADFFRMLDTAMEDACAPWDLLEIEITETCLMQNDRQLIDQFSRLRARGVIISLDDFGTGYSNLARLRSLPIDRLKIDRSLVSDIATCGEAATISHSIVALAHGLGYTVVAEGVENKLQTEVLRVIGADMLQGYLIAKPMPEAEFPGWMRQFVAENTCSTIRV